MLSDLVMPKMGGKDLVRELRVAPPTRKCWSSPVPERLSAVVLMWEVWLRAKVPTCLR